MRGVRRRRERRAAERLLASLRRLRRGCDGDDGSVVEAIHVELCGFAEEEFEAADQVAEAVIGGDVGQRESGAVVGDAEFKVAVPLHAVDPD